MSNRRASASAQEPTVFTLASTSTPSGSQLAHAMRKLFSPVHEQGRAEAGVSAPRTRVFHQTCALTAPTPEYGLFALGRLVEKFPPASCRRNKVINASANSALRNRKALPSSRGERTRRVGLARMHRHPFAYQPATRWRSAFTAVMAMIVGGGCAGTSSMAEQAARRLEDGVADGKADARRRWRGRTGLTDQAEHPALSEGRGPPAARGVTLRTWRSESGVPDDADEPLL